MGTTTAPSAQGAEVEDRELRQVRQHDADPVARFHAEFGEPARRRLAATSRAA